MTLKISEESWKHFQKITQVLFKDVIYMQALHSIAGVHIYLIWQVKSVLIQLFGHMQSLQKNFVT